MAGVMQHICAGTTDKTHLYRAPVSTVMTKTTGFKQKIKKVFDSIVILQLAAVNVKDKKQGLVREGSSGEILVSCENL